MISIAKNASAKGAYMHVSQVKAEWTDPRDRLFAGIDNPDEIRAALAAGANPNGPDAKGRPPLYAAAECAKPECLELLLDAGALLDAWTGPKTNALAGSALNVAILRRNFSAAHFLLERGARVDLTDGWGRDALHYLVRLQGNENDPESLDEAEILALVSKALDLDPTVTREDQRGHTALHTAVDRNASPAVVNELMRRGADPTAKNLRSETVLHSRWAGDNIHLLALLFAAGADLNARDRYGCTALFYALDGTAVRSLIAAGVSSTTVTYEGENALNYVISREWKQDQVVALLEAGLDTQQRAHDGMSAEEKIDWGLPDNADELDAIIRSHRAQAAIRSAALPSPKP